MSIQEFTRGGLSYGQMMEDQDGLFHQGGSMIFCCQEGYSSTADDFTTLQEAADAWACWMRYQGHEVIELPRTARTREWSLVSQVKPDLPAESEEAKIEDPLHAIARIS